jgi:hypothetical protein
VWRRGADLYGSPQSPATATANDHARRPLCLRIAGIPIGLEP